MSQITPAFVKEAHALLSQSIIHVEKDDVEIDSDDDDDDDDHQLGPGGAPVTSQSGPGVSSPTRRQEPAVNDDEDRHDDDERQPSAGPSGTAGRDRDSTPTAAPAPLPPKKPKVTISYEKYMTIMQKVVYMLAEVERETNAGLPKSEVVQRYLDDIETEMTDLEQLESETVLMEKVLSKLVKVGWNVLGNNVAADQGLTRS